MKHLTQEQINELRLILGYLSRLHDVCNQKELMDAFECINKLILKELCKK